ncbi:hypothetical protein H310_10110 [Aphanomyces invadans]|uniref:Zinc finger CHCC-type domain-containing protein n=1 Tax=Aphanomyces invadans TaxID=157072 RepID=A0A024TS26_9STRA|nr:hypothetical protein H310_10110 [Aphanomyces invadans]ETV96819.1 hypothetical protein H310_10110 [Aphanomyces invadans]|eukprot:XP_008874596.1 hypothetical protein H310_10110 [Aphanomyces invadans]
MRGHQVFRAVRAAPLRRAAVKAMAPRAFAAVQQAAGYATIYDLKTPFEDTNRHRSDAEILIAQVPVVEVDSDVAVCDGGGGALGHPLEYIALNTVSDKPQTCKYCGLRYKQKPHHHH